MTWRGQEGTYNAEGITALANALRVSQSLYSIDVGYNGIDQAAALELLAVMKEKAMVSIGMAGCKLGVEGAKVVAEMAAVSQSMTQVQLDTALEPAACSGPRFTMAV